MPAGRKLWLLLAMALAAPAAAQSAGAAGPQVSVTGGDIRGLEVDRALLFQAIPFAAPPLGPLRWKPPQPVVPWNGLRDATRPAPACLQNNENWNKADWLRGNEDCLTISVRTPSLAGKRPVMVWIHGGSNRAGSGFGVAESQMVKQGVVVVSLHYRLGILGYLSHRGLDKEQGGTSGNYGLMDQIAALKWVRDNIAKFGGDPSHVTIFGESAGSQDVSLLLAAPDAQGLFHAAILQSGTPGFGMSYRSHADALQIGDQLDGLAESGGDLERLRAMSPLALFDIQSKLQDPFAHGNDFLFLRTTIDGKVLPAAPDQLIAYHAPKPVIIGTDRIEFGPGPGGTELGGFARFWFGENSREALAAYRAEEGRVDARRGNLELRMQSDAQFHCPANRLANLLLAKGWPVWRYEFDVGPDGGWTRHAYEVGFVFDRKAAGGGAQMQDYWAALALAGDPNAPTDLSAKRLRWDRMKAGKQTTLVFGNDKTEQVSGQPRAAMCGWSTAF